MEKNNKEKKDYEERVRLNNDVIKSTSGRTYNNNNVKNKNNKKTEVNNTKTDNEKDDVERMNQDSNEETEDLSEETGCFLLIVKLAAGILIGGTVILLIAFGLCALVISGL